jgi:hypothetical protein
MLFNIKLQGISSAMPFISYICLILLQGHLPDCLWEATRRKMEQEPNELNPEFTDLKEPACVPELVAYIFLASTPPDPGNKYAGFSEG